MHRILISRFPYQNFNSPPFSKRAPLQFIKWYKEKAEEDDLEENVCGLVKKKSVVMDVAGIFT